MQSHTINGSAGPVKICLFGAAPDTSNLGVSALFLSVVNAIFRRYPDAQITVFDWGRGLRRAEVVVDGIALPITRCGANMSRRYYRRDNMFNMWSSAALGGLGNPGVIALQDADVVLDISGGDSFSDIYGKRRFRMMAQFKQLVLSLKTPLILLPQTYGPFEDPGARSVASDIVRGSNMALARDLESFEMLKTMLGADFDPERHVPGVDVAFALPKNRPEYIPPRVTDWLATTRTRPVIGLNVSGLIYNAGQEGSRKFGFKSDYRDLVHGLLRRLLECSDANIVLIPHVLSPDGHYESDTGACNAVAEFVGSDDRVCVLECDYDATEMKWIISQLDFFCGTRMHSTIAGLSSEVPTAAIAYSKKTQGVFETCGQGKCVTDPRQLDAEQCVENVWRVWQRREEVARLLAANVPPVRQQAFDQMDVILKRLT